MIEMPWTNATAPNFMIEVTNACNLKCKACYKSHGNRFKTLEEIAKDLDDGLRLRPAHTVAIAGGEPSLHPRIEDIIRKVKERNVHVFMTTNGVAVDQEALKRYKRGGLDFVLFHVDSGQSRPDLPPNPSFTDIERRVNELAGMADACGIDVSISATLYDDWRDMLPKISNAFFANPKISFLFLSRAVNPVSLEGADTTIGEIEAFFKDKHGLEPFAFIRASSGNAKNWVSFFAPYYMAKSGGFRALAVKSNWMDACLMRMVKMLAGRHVHKTRQNPTATGVRIFLNALAGLRVWPWLVFTVKRIVSGAKLRHKMIAYDDGPRRMADGGFDHCEYCPTAIVRDGALLACCEADTKLKTRETA